MRMMIKRVEWVVPPLAAWVGLTRIDYIMQFI